MPKRAKRLLSILVLIILVASLPFVVVRVLRPPRTDYSAELYQGISYVREARQAPRPLMVHIIEIDVQAQGTSFLVTPGDSSNGMEVLAQTTSVFLEEHSLQVAINGSFSEPFRAGVFLWDFYPHSGDPVDVTGLSISNGERYSEHDGWPALCITAERPEIVDSNCPNETSQALAGSQILVKDGDSLVQQDTGGLHPRTAAAVDKDGNTLWLIVVDGRQRGYSEGVTLKELAGIAVEVGADRALNLDGGGSSTLVIADGARSRALNSPIHKRVPTRQRPVANHLGVYAQPIDE